MDRELLAIIVFTILFVTAIGVAAGLMAPSGFRAWHAGVALLVLATLIAYVASVAWVTRTLMQ